MKILIGILVAFISLYYLLWPFSLSGKVSENTSKIECVCPKKTYILAMGNVREYIDCNDIVIEKPRCFPSGPCYMETISRYRAPDSYLRLVKVFCD
jgi:hypothetical protein